MAANHGGFSVLEIITVVAGITLITAIASTTFQNIFRQNQVDAVQAHLNNAGNECLKALQELPAPQANQSLTSYRKSVEQELSLANNGTNPNDLLNKNYPYLINAIDDKLLKDNGYKINENYSTCMTIKLDPIDAESTSHPTLGFGVYRNRLTKIGSSSSKKPDALSACREWASSYCSTNESNKPEKFYEHMWDVTYSRNICEIDFNHSISNNSDQSEHLRWDANKDGLCNNLVPEANGGSKYKQCTLNRCTKKAWALDGEFVGYSESSYNQAEALACDKKIQEYINSSSYAGGSEEKTGLTNCKKPALICNYQLMRDADSYNHCKIQSMISKCNADLERIRTTGTDDIEYIVGEGKLSGLPPCGQSVWVYDKVIEFEKRDRSE